MPSIMVKAEKTLCSENLNRIGQDLNFENSSSYGGLVTKTKSPDAVIAVYNLAKSLDVYNGVLETPVNDARQIMVQGLNTALSNFMVDTQNMKPNTAEYQNRLGGFNSECKEVLRENYKPLAASPTI